MHSIAVIDAPQSPWLLVISLGVIRETLGTYVRSTVQCVSVGIANSISISDGDSDGDSDSDDDDDDDSDSYSDGAVVVAAYS